MQSATECEVQTETSQIPNEIETHGLDINVNVNERGQNNDDIQTENSQIPDGMEPYGLDDEHNQNDDGIEMSVANKNRG